MPSHKRGKIKEHLEGIHRNCEAIKEHVIKSLAIVGGENERVSRGLTAVGKVAESLDEITQTLYGSL